MCGINVIISSRSDKKELVQKMNKILGHRGLDNDGIYENEHVALGHRRLSIIDISEASNQPMISADENIILVFNGEIYNYQELKSKTNYPYKSKSDSEVIIALYQEHGKDFIRMLDGMFSLCIYDKIANQLFIARDRLGIKPLYYSIGNDYLVISSEIRPIIKEGIFKAELDTNSLEEYVNYSTVYAPNTIIKNVKMVSPGTTISLDIADILNNNTSNNGLLPEKKYWHLKEDPARPIPTSMEETEKNIKELFISSVEKRLISDVKLGAFLSGGIDSTAVVGVMSKLMNEKVETFNICFDEKLYSESKYARLVAKKFNTDHHEIKITSNYFLDNLENALQAMDHPSADGLNSYFVSQATKNAGMSVSLSGVGGDELFAGYDIFDVLKKMHGSKWIWKSPLMIKKALSWYRTNYKPGMISDILSSTILDNEFTYKNTHRDFRRIFTPDESSSILGTNFKYRLKDIPEFEDDKQLSTISSYEICTYLQNILLPDIDKMSMASTLEVRVPFLDHDFANYVLNIPDKFKGLGKKTLISSLSEFLPEEMLNRPKHGFYFPILHWFSSERKAWGEDLINEFGSREGINSKVVKSLWRDYIETGTDEAFTKIWHLIVLEYWLKNNLD